MVKELFIDFLHHVLPFILFKIIIQICKIMSYILAFFSNKPNHNKIHDFYKNILNKINDQTCLNKSPTIKIWSE
jgi:ABC-type uncharacterized transport system permease subunit